MTTRAPIVVLQLLSYIIWCVFLLKYSYIFRSICCGSVLPLSQFSTAEKLNQIIINNMDRVVIYEVGLRTSVSF